MVSPRDADQGELVKHLAQSLEGKIKMPEWARFVKTGVSRERAPEQNNWWYMRTASVLRKVSYDGPIGAEKLRSFYGGLHRRGHKPAHFAKGSGKIVRVMLQDMEKAGLIKKEKKGRVATAEGYKLVTAAAKKSK